jgi:hypothetical protein
MVYRRCILTALKQTTTSMMSLIQEPSTQTHHKMRDYRTWQRRVIVRMIRSKEKLITSQICQCSECSVTDIRRRCGFSAAPNTPSSVGRPSTLFLMLDALVITLPKSRTYTWERWLFSGMNPVYCRRLLAQTCSFLRWLDMERPSKSYVRIRRGRRQQILWASQIFDVSVIPVLMLVSPRCHLQGFVVCTVSR